MRLFFAIELPEEARRHLVRIQNALQHPADLAASVSWVKRENLHLTLKFLNEVEASRVPELIASMPRICGEPMNLMSDGMLYFPRRGPVRVVGVSIGGDSDKLGKLHKQIESTCSEIGFAEEGRPFTAHITLGWSRQGERGDGALLRLRDMKLEKLFFGPTFVVRDFVLMESHLRPQGSEYRVAARFPIGS